MTEEDLFGWGLGSVIPRSIEQIRAYNMEKERECVITLFSSSPRMDLCLKFKFLWERGNIGRRPPREGG